CFTAHAYAGISNGLESLVAAPRRLGGQGRARHADPELRGPRALRPGLLVLRRIGRFGVVEELQAIVHERVEADMRPGRGAWIGRHCEAERFLRAIRLD